MKTISNEEWFEQYKPMMDEDNTYVRLDTQDVAKIYLDIPKIVNHVWTETDGNNIVAGYHFVNRLSYILTMYPHTGKNSVYVEYDEHDND